MFNIGNSDSAHRSYFVSSRSPSPFVFHRSHSTTDHTHPTTQRDDEPARKWVNSQRTNRQKPKPIGDSVVWHGRESHLPKIGRNVRRVFKHKLRKTFGECDQLAAESAHDVVDMANHTLMTWYRRLHYLDAAHIIINGRPGEPEELTYMNEEQERELENATGMQAWYDGVEALSGAAPWPAQDHHPSTASAASSSTTPPQLWPNVPGSPTAVPSPHTPPPAGKLSPHVPPPPPPPPPTQPPPPPPTSQLRKPEPQRGMSPWIQPAPDVPFPHTGDTS